MDWLLSPTTYMVELVPTKQNGADGCVFEVGDFLLSILDYCKVFPRYKLSNISVWLLCADYDPESSFRCSCEPSCSSEA
jgi:hypothetical protein